MPRKKIQKLTESENNDSTNEKSSGEINIVENKIINDVYDDEDIIDISQLKGKEIWHYSMLEKFFLNCELQTIEKMVDIINGNHLISLRFLDWFVTRYCYLYKININLYFFFRNFYIILY